MMGTLAENLAGVVIGEASGQGRRARGNSSGSVYQQEQQQQPRTLANLIDAAMDLSKRLAYVLFKLLQYMLIVQALFVAAAVLYGSLYWLVMPLRLHEAPLYFDYSYRGKTRGATATVDFLARHTQWDASPVIRVERRGSKVLMSGQQYDVGLELKMPTSYANRRVGVFMVYTELLDDEDNVLATSARPAMLPHTSELLKGVRMLFYWPLYLFGFKEETETVLLSCIDLFQESGKHRMTKAKVTVSSGRVQFYDASINITPQLKGLPWLMHDWFYTTLAAGILFIVSLELMMIGFVYVFFFLSLAEGPQPGGGTSPGTPSSRRGNNAGSGNTGCAPRRTNASVKSPASTGGGRSGAPSPSVTTSGRQSPSGGYGSSASSTSQSATSTPVGGTLRRRPSAAGGTRGSAGGRQPERPPIGMQSYQRGEPFVLPGSDENAGDDVSGVRGAGGAVVGSAEGWEAWAEGADVVAARDSSAGGDGMVPVVGEESDEVLGVTEGGAGETVHDLTENMSISDKR